jgi:hypothetical protein
MDAMCDALHSASVAPFGALAFERAAALWFMVAFYRT